MSGKAAGSDTNHGQTRLEGKLGLLSIVLMVVAGAAPLTVVGGPVPLAFALGNGSGLPTMFLITGVILVLFSVGFTAMSRYVPTAGAFYSYAFVGIGRRTGIGTGYAALLSYFTLYVGMYGLLGPAINSLIVSYGGPTLPWWLWSLFSMLVVGFVGYQSIEFSGKILGVLLAAEVLIVVVLDAAIVFTGGHGHGFSTGFLKVSEVFSGAPGIAFLFAVLGFIGFEATVVFRDEARDPERTLPRATYIAALFIAIFYSLTSWAMLSGGGEKAIIDASTTAPDAVLPNLARDYLGQVGVDLVRILFVTSIFACVLTFHNVVARYMFSLANRDLLPRVWNRVHPRHGSPYTASLTLTLATLACLGFGVVANLDPINQFYTWLVGLASLGYIALLVVTAAASIVFFHRRPSLPVHVWHAKIAPALALIGLVATLVVVLRNVMVLVGDNVAAAFGVIVSVIIAFALGPIIAAFRPEGGWEIEVAAPSDEFASASQSGDVLARPIR